MSDFLCFEPADDADAKFRNFMRSNLGHAALHFNVVVCAYPKFGWRLRSIGAVVARQNKKYWLRILSEELEWEKGSAWTGNTDANRITGIAKPTVIDFFEWHEFNWRRQRAELMTLILEEPCSPTALLHNRLNQSDLNWNNLRQSLQLLANIETKRCYADQNQVTTGIQQRFGRGIDTAVQQWAVVHGDLHWSNLMKPHFHILDWELWGRGPAAIDAATLLCFSLLEPNTRLMVEKKFSDLLATATGRISKLFVAARLFNRIEGGDFRELEKPLRQFVNALGVTARSR